MIEDNEQPLTDWVNEPKVKDLKRDLEDSKDSHSTQESKISKWLDYLNVEGVARTPKIKGRSNVHPQLIRKQAEWRYSALSEPFLSTEDLFSISPVTYEDKKAAKQNDLILNKQFNTTVDRVRFIDEYVRTAVDEGTVIVKVGWDNQEELIEEEVPVYGYRPAETAEEASMLEPWFIALEEDPNTFKNKEPEYIQLAVQQTIEAGIPIIPYVVDYEEVETIRTLRNTPTLEVCDYRNVYLDPTCYGNLDKANFVIHSFESSLAELTKAGIYTNLDKLKEHLSSVDQVLGDTDHSTDLADPDIFDDVLRRRVVAYDYWGYWDAYEDNNPVPILATFVDDVMVQLIESPAPDRKPPFVVVPYLPKKRSSYGEPDGALLQENQDIIGALSRGMIDVLGKSAAGQKGIRKDALDVLNKRRYDKGQDYEFNHQVDPRQAIMQHNFPELPQSAYTMLGIQNNEAEALTGVKAYSGGISGENLGDTATGVRGALDAASKRELGILRRLVSGIVEIGRKIIALNSEFLSDSEIVRITNDEFVAIDREDLRGDFDLKVDITTYEEDNQKAQELAFMVQTMGNVLDYNIIKFMLAKIAMLRKMPTLANLIEEYQPEPDPLEIEKQQLEIEKLRAEIEEIRSRSIKHQTTAVVDEAKARNLNSKTDLDNLDFIEQESGVKQERAIQKDSAQARANVGLEIVKSFLNGRNA